MSPERYQEMNTGKNLKNSGASYCGESGRKVSQSPVERIGTGNAQHSTVPRSPISAARDENVCHSAQSPAYTIQEGMKPLPNSPALSPVIVQVNMNSPVQQVPLCQTGPAFRMQNTLSRFINETSEQQLPVQQLVKQLPMQCIEPQLRMTNCEEPQQSRNIGELPVVQNSAAQHKNPLPVGSNESYLHMEHARRQSLTVNTVGQNLAQNAREAISQYAQMRQLGNECMPQKHAHQYRSRSTNGIELNCITTTKPNDSRAVQQQPIEQKNPLPIRTQFVQGFGALHRQQQQHSHQSVSIPSDMALKVVAIPTSKSSSVTSGASIKPGIFKQPVCLGIGDLVMEAPAAGSLLSAHGNAPGSRSANRTESFRSAFWREKDKAEGTLWGKPYSFYAELKRRLPESVPLFHAVQEIRRGLFGPALDVRVSLLSTGIREDLSCPICMGILENTVVVKTCLHRFCTECIEKCVRIGIKECPQCRGHVASRRSLRPDPIFDAVVRMLFHDVREFEGKNALVLAKANLRLQASATVGQSTQNGSAASPSAKIPLGAITEVDSGRVTGGKVFANTPNMGYRSVWNLSAQSLHDVEGDSHFSPTGLSVDADGYDIMRKDKRRSARKVNEVVGNGIPSVSSRFGEGGGSSNFEDEEYPPRSIPAYVDVNGKWQCRNSTSISGVLQKASAAEVLGISGERQVNSDLQRELSGISDGSKYLSMFLQTRLSAHERKRARKDLYKVISKIQDDQRIHFELLPDPLLPYLPSLKNSHLSTQGTCTVLQLSRFVASQLVKQQRHEKSKDPLKDSGDSVRDLLPSFCLQNQELVELRFYSKEHRVPFGPNLTLVAVHVLSLALPCQTLVLYYSTRPYGDDGVTHSHMKNHFYN